MSGAAFVAGALLAMLAGAPAGPTSGPVPGGQFSDAAPRTAVLVVDTSGSMGRSGIEAARRAAQVYADTLGPRVRVGLVSFADRPHLLTAATTDRAALRAGIARLAPRGETALYDALLLATREAGPHGNVVLLSDGGDTTSTAGLDQALAAVTAGGVRADVVAFNTPESDRGPLERIAAAGHGRVVPVSDAASLGRAFAAAATAVASPATSPTPLPSPSPPSPSPSPSSSASAPAISAPAVLAERVPAAPRWLTPWGLGGAVSVVLGLLVLVGARPGGGGAELNRRRRRKALAPYMTSDSADAKAGNAGNAGTGGGGDGGPGGEGSAASHAAAGVLHLCERMVAAGGRRSSIALRLDRAGLTLLPNEWVTLRASIALVCGAGVLLLLHPRGVGLLLGGGLGWAATGAWLRSRQSRRCRAFAEQLPDTLQTVASSLRSGFSLQQALAATQETAPQPMASELGRSLAAARIGAVLEDELEQIAVRMCSEDWRMAVMAIRIQRSVGGNLSEVLSTTARTLRERSAVARQVRALSAEGRLSAYILLGLPVGVGLFLMAFRRPYLEPLWTTSAGVGMLVVSAIGMVVGSWWMFKVAEVEV